jgi:bifunctional enzyme CysN/CysC
VEVIRTSGGADRVIAVWLGDRMTTDLTCDLVITSHEVETDGAKRLKALLHERGAIFRPW